MNEEKLKKVVERIFDKMNALQKKYAQTTISCERTKLTFMVRSLKGRFVVPISMVRKPFIASFQFVCNPEDLITETQLKENLKDAIMKADERLRKAKSEKVYLPNKE